ncbi:MAG: dipeptide epimerase [Candidatus Saccharicenans sp.]|nr:MAG: dipeptide epimerase [Candidatus Aminicenantes bacterium]HEK86472.1 dipeptide epimerase [Candidatus Aminicenantes bacterium]
MNRKEFFKTSGWLLASSWLFGRKPELRLKKEETSKKGKVKVTTRIYELHLRQAWTLSRGTWTTRRNVLVRLEKDGIVGYGEAAPIPRYNESAESNQAFIAKALPILEKDLWEYEERGKELEQLLPGENAAKAALDMAILDWIGKSLKIPLYRFFGLDKSKTLSTTFSIGIDEVPVMQKTALAAKDFRVLKIKVGTKDDKKIIEGIREVTDRPIRVDANEGWKTKEEALEMINWLADKGVEFVEQPLPAANLDDYRWLKERVKIPIFADESVHKSHDIPALASAFDGINVKLMKCGGLQEAMRMVAVARAFDLKLMIGCMIESSLSISAAAAITPLFDYADLDGNLLIDNDPFRGEPIKGDRLQLSDRPGLGAEPLIPDW